jgi:osmoprotectant transport system ATP-binding protein
MLEFKQVSKQYGDVRALGRIDLSIRANGTTVLIGPSGCGKSTLLRMAVGLLRPDHGSITFNGNEIDSGNILAIRRKIGYVIQEGGLFPHCNARDNVTLMARYLKWPKERTESRLHILCALTHFPEGGLGRYPAELSGGQRQRVCLMRALMLDPDLLLLDEPFGALDPMIRHSLQEELGEIFRELRKTVLMVTHDLAEAAYFADDIVLMRKGSIVQQGTFDELYSSPADTFVTSFIDAQRGLMDSLNGGAP